jgi:hypothetical protein
LTRQAAERSLRLTMDKQNRLTRVDELEIGARYQWLNDGVLGPVYTLKEIRFKGRNIRLIKDGDTEEIAMFCWRNRLIRVG